MTDTQDKLANAKAQGQAQFDSIVEMVEALKLADDARCSGPENREYEGAEQLWETAEQTILEDALSVEVRSDWYMPHDCDLSQHQRATEYRILLCTGGPAVRIIGTLSEHCEPETARLEVQDWFTSWVEFHPTLKGTAYGEPPHQETLLTYARCFWFGE